MRSRVLRSSFVSSIAAAVIAFAATASAQEDTGIPVFPGQPGVPLPTFNGKTDSYTFARWWYLNQEPLLDLRRSLTQSFDARAGYRRVLDSDYQRVLIALEAVQGDSSPAVRAAADLALAKSREREALASLLKEPAEGIRAPLFDSNTQVRRSAILGLGIAGDSAALETLRGIIVDTKWEPELRAVAAMAIGMIEVGPSTSHGKDDDAKKGDERKATAPSEAKELAEVATLDAAVTNVSAVAVDPTSDRAVLGFDDGKLAIWPWKLGKLGKTWAVHAGRVTALRFAPDGDRVASVGSDGTLRIHSLKIGKELVKFDGLGDVRALDFDKKGEKLIVGNAAGDVYFVPASGKKEFVEKRSSHKGAVSAVAFAGDRGIALSAGADGVVMFHETKAGVTPRVFMSLGSPIVALTITGDGQFAALATDEGRLNGFTLDGDRERSLWSRELKGKVRSLVGDKKGESFALALEGSGVYTLSANGGDPLGVATVEASALDWSGSEATTLVAITSGGGGKRYSVPLRDEAEKAPKPVIPGDDTKSSGKDAKIVKDRATILDGLLEISNFSKLDPLVQDGVALGAALTADPALIPPLEKLVETGGKSGISAPTLGYATLAYGRLVALAGEKGEKTDKLLKFTTKSDLAEVRKFGALALGRALAGKGGSKEGASVVQAIVTRLEFSNGESDRRVKDALLMSLGRIGGDRATSYLRSELHGGEGSGIGTLHPQPRLNAQELDAAPLEAIALALAKDSLGYKIAQNKFGKEGSLLYRGALVIALGLHGVGQTAANREIELALKKEKSPVLVAHFALALGLARAIDAQDTLNAKFQDSKLDATILPQVAVAMAMLEAPSSRKVPAMIAARMLSSKQATEAAALAFALGLVGDTTSVGPLLQVLHDAKASSDVRAAAAAALGELLDPGPFRKLGAALDTFDGIEDVRIIALVSG